MRRLSNADAELKKGLAHKKSVRVNFLFLMPSESFITYKEYETDQ